MQLIRKLLISGVISFLSVFWLLGQSVVADNGDLEEYPVEEDNTPFGLINTVTAGNTAFALDLYAQLKAAKSGNLFFSPYSISAALAMTYAGAKGTTEAQMSEVLHFSTRQDLFHLAFRHLRDQIKNAAQNGVELSIANALWGQQGYSFHKEFQDILKKRYEAPLEEADFAKEYPTIHEQINTWVEDHTRNKIKDLIPEGVLTSLTRLVLVNAIYFKGHWANPFEEAKTKQRPFWVTAWNSIEVPMMTQKNSFRYQEIEGLQVLELPYASPNQKRDPFEPPFSYGEENISMIVLLPEQRNGLAALENSLSSEKLEQWLERLKSQKVRVWLPKFKISTGFELSKTLEKMGMPDAFNDNADFSGMTEQEKLYIMSIIHKAFVEVNEKGTEAAATTAVFFATKGLSPPTPTFRADHPFIFLIRHNLSGSILFMGRIQNPLK